jgi:hypothetical protein
MGKDKLQSANTTKAGFEESKESTTNTTNSTESTSASTTIDKTSNKTKAG